MYSHNVTRALGADVAVDAAAEGQSLVTGNTIDAAGYESVAFLIQLGTISAGGTVEIKVQAGDQSNGSDMADVPGAVVELTDADAGKGVWSAELHRPTKRYVRAVITRGTANSAVAGGFAVLGRAGHTPPDAGANMVDQRPPVIVSNP